MNMKKILLALGIGAGVGAAYYFAKKKLDEMQEENEMYYDMYAAHPYTPGPAGPAKRSAAAAAETPASRVFFCWYINDLCGQPYPTNPHGPNTDSCRAVGKRIKLPLHFFANKDCLT